MSKQNDLKEIEIDTDKIVFCYLLSIKILN